MDLGATQAGGQGFRTGFADRPRGSTGMRLAGVGGTRLADAGVAAATLRARRSGVIASEGKQSPTSFRGFSRGDCFDSLAMAELGAGSIRQSRNTTEDA